MTDSRSSHHHDLNPIDIDIPVSDSSIWQDQNSTPADATAVGGHISADLPSYQSAPPRRMPQGDKRVDIVDEILAVDPAKFLQWTPEGRPEYINGKVHLTDAQWERILAARPPSARHRPAARAVWGIPVVLRPARTTTEQTT